MPDESNSSETDASSIDLGVVKKRAKATWEDGDYASFATYMEAGAEEILGSWKIAPGQALLDIGCGSGQSAIPAARMGLSVTGVDIAENLVEHANHRAKSESLDAHFHVGDAEKLPCENDSFDVVITMIGAMFAPRPDRVASEIARVLRPGGKLYMANWTPRGMPALMFKCVSSHVPPPLGAMPPVLWGDEATVRERLEENFGEFQMTRKNYPQWQYPFSASELVDYFRKHFGPVKRAFENIDIETQKILHNQLEEIYIKTSEVSAEGIKIVKGEYLDITATRL
jgi:ubiquinone/menaquinone biosynthesis C-methylase UbiE